MKEEFGAERSEMAKIKQVEYEMTIVRPIIVDDSLINC